ncbi:hypothetical protein A2U01_0085623, partial [Trifolium medium]|nr:hypothetical protein [Trifolium medium]
SYQPVLQARSAAPQSAAPPHAPQAQAPCPAAPPDTVKTLHVCIRYV